MTNLVQRGYIFENTSKNWHSYILKYLEYSLERINYFEGNLENMLLSKYILSSSFVVYHNQVDGCFMVNPNVIYLKDWLYSRNIEDNTILDKGCTYLRGSHKYLNKPTGKQLDSLNQFVNDCSLNLYHSYTWNVYLDQRLSLNVTLQELYFSSGINYCVGGNLTFYQNVFDDNYNHSNFCKWQSKNKNILKPFLSYCGHYAVVNIYPSVSIFRMTTYYHYSTISFMNMSYSVMDKEIIISKHSTTPTIVISGILFVNRRSRIFTFVIKVLKVNHIQMVMTLNSTKFHIIYDGPGLLSSRVVGNKNVYNCSTFQCTLHICLKM